MLSRERTSGLEQYYTIPSVVDYCLEIMRPYIQPHHTLLEPCAGKGNFLDGYRRAGFSNPVEAYDIDPKVEGIEEMDFLLKTFPFACPRKYCTITNPPFGRMSSLAVPFFNKCALVSEVIGFLVPRSWNKGSFQNRLNLGFSLEEAVPLPGVAFEDDAGNPYGGGKLQTVFQVWRYTAGHSRKKVYTENRGYFKKVPPEEADVVVVGFGRGAGRVERVFERVPNTTKLFLKVESPDIIDALEKIDPSRFTKEVAYTEVISMGELRILLNEYFDKESANG